MLAIILSACLVTEPTTCTEHRLPAGAEVNPFHCVMQAQPFVARWADEHPDWEVKRFSCRPQSENDG